MSAYLCDDVHLATLAVAYADLVGMPPDFAQNLADALKLANLRSVNHRYAEDTPFEGCSLAQHQARTRWPGVKFSVRTDRYAGGSSLDVRWTDGPTVDQVDAIAKRYRAGSFDA